MPSSFETAFGLLRMRAWGVLFSLILRVSDSERLEGRGKSYS